MDQKLWLLIEWMDKCNIMFSNYGVVNTNNLLSHDTDLHIGKVVFLRDRRNNSARKAQILRVSDNKQYIKGLKVMQERQDNQMKNILSLCMNTIKEMKTGPVSVAGNQTLTLPCHSRTNTMNTNGDDSSFSDSTTDHEENHDLNLTKSTIKFSNHQARRSEYIVNGQVNDKSIIRKRRSLVTSTPLPDRHVEKTTVNIATQTDPIDDDHFENIEKCEMVLKKLYSQIVSLLPEEESRSITDTSEDHRPDENVYMITEEPVLDCQNTSVDSDGTNKTSGLKVRRASAQTTSASLPMISYSGDMATIGNGNVTEPANLFAEIDWTSHSAATRQLLLAVFSRRILATHSLTGKHSSAFVNPPKKQLNPTLVKYIVNIVSARCGVRKPIVRSYITTICKDEAKLYRNRRKFKKMREKYNQENFPPASTSSNESTAACEGQETRD